MAYLRELKVLVDDVTASTTAPTGTAIGSQALPIPEHCTDLELTFILSGVSTPDVDVTVYVLREDGSWYEEASFALQDLEDETGDRYSPVFSDPWIYKAIQPVFTLNSGSATMRCTATIRTRS